MNKDPSKVPRTMNVNLFDLAEPLARSANARGTSINEEIRRRLKESLDRDPPPQQEKR